MSRIVSASRRTDLPAFYADWLLGRLEAGFVRVPNPYNPRQVARISLLPQDVDAIVLWTKHPEPLFDRIDRIESLGHRFYFQYTLNDYPRELEPGLPPLPDRLGTFQKLSERIGPERVVWRYDPVIISNRTDHAYHREAFARLVQAIGSSTRRVMVSVVDFYKKTRRNLAALHAQGFEFDEGAIERPELDALMGSFVELAGRLDIQVFSCAERRDFSGLGVRPGACIDSDLIRALWGRDTTWKKDAGQRGRCRCVESRDIGAFDTCLHGCLYCYATNNPAQARDRYAAHEPAGASLIPESSSPLTPR